MNPAHVLLGLTVIAALSPLLTFMRLWQIKAWRCDRLKEYLWHENGIKVVFGVIRPIVVLLAIIGSFLPALELKMGLYALAALTILQIVLRKQPIPKRTVKTIIIGLVSISITVVITLALQILSGSALGLIILAGLMQPLIIGLAWVMFLPVDWYSKKRIMHNAAIQRRFTKNISVIGITGSMGKTTTKELLYHVLQPLNPAATPAYVNADIGVARWLIKTLKQIEPPTLLIIEMGAYRPGEIAALCKVAQPTVGILTGVSNQHLGLFGSQENIQNAKAELLESVPNTGQCFINGNSNLALEVKEKSTSKTTIVGTNQHCDFQAKNLISTTAGLQFECGDTTFKVPMHGEHNISNVLLVIAVARNLGMSDKHIVERLAEYEPPVSTFNVIQKNGTVILNDTHNLSPASFKAALRWAKQQNGPVTLITPGIIELGSATERTHIELGGDCSDVIDTLVCTNPQRAALLQKGFSGTVFGDLNELPAHSVLLLLGQVPQKYHAL